MEDAQIYGHSRCDNGEEDYIELEVIGSSNSTISLFHFKNSSPPQQQEARSSEFEFQMLPSFIDRNTTSSTADELFYNGKLLPLDHIPLHNNNPISNKFLHVGKNIVDFEQSFGNPCLQSCNVSQEDYFFDYSTDDDSTENSKFLHVSKSFDDFDQSLSTWKQPLAEMQDKDAYKRSLWSGPSLNTAHGGIFSAPDCRFCRSCHTSRTLNQEEYYSTHDESSKGSKVPHLSKSFDDFDQSLSTLFCQSCHVSRKLINQEEYYYSTDDEKSTSKTSKVLHVSKSFDDLKQSFSTPFFQSCHVSGELSNQEDYFFGYSTDGESSRKSKCPKGSLTRKLRLIKQLSFDHSKLKCLINTSVNKLLAKKDFFGKIHHKKSSFSGAIKSLLATKSCSSKNSNVNIQEMHLLVRRDHVYAEVDPIQAAIAHCKNSHQVKQKLNSRKSNVSDTIELGRSLSASKIMFEEQERTGLCRG